MPSTLYATYVRAYNHVGNDISITSMHACFSNIVSQFYKL